MADQILYGGFRRLRNFALDPTSIVQDISELKAYLNNPISYPGQVITVIADPEPANNGQYIIEKCSEVIDGVLVEKKITKTASIEEVTEIIAPIKKFIGMPIDNSSGPNEDNENNILTRIDKIESILELNDDDNEKDKVNDLRNELNKLSDDLKALSDNIGNEELEKVFVTIDNFDKNNQQISKTITDTVDAAKEELRTDIKILQDYVDLLDNGKIDEIFKDVIKDVNYIRNNINSLLQNFQANFEQMLVNSFNNSYNDPSTGMFKNLVLEVLEKEGLDTKINSNSTEIDTIKGVQAIHSTSISDNKTKIEKLEKDIDDKVSTEEFKSFEEINTKLITELTANTKKTVSFKFGSDDNTTTSIKLPQGCTITEIRVLIETASSIKDLSGFIQLNSGELFIGSENTGDLYFDITGAEYIIEKTVKTTTTEPTIMIWSSNDEQTDFGGTIGQVFVTYY